MRWIADEQMRTFFDEDFQDLLQRFQGRDESERIQPEDRAERIR